MKNWKGMYIKNFQSHKDTKLDFAPTITTFVGASDSGKTSIFRVMELIVKNEPKGTDYITVGESRMTAGIILEDGTEVVRERTKSLNRYNLHHPDGTSLPLEGFGRDIPPDIAEALDYYPVKVDTGMTIDLNFSKQLDGPFLLSSDDFSKAKTIDALAKINVFNIALRNTNRKIKGINTEIRSLDRDLDRLAEQMKQFEDLEKTELLLAELGEIISRLESLEKARDLYVGLNQQYQQVNEQIKANDFLIESLKGINEAGRVLDTLQLMTSKKTMFINLSNSMKRVATDISDTEQVLTGKENLLALEKATAELNQLHNRKNQLTNALRGYTDLTGAIAKGNAFVKALQPINGVDQLLMDMTAAQSRRTNLLSVASQLGRVSNETVEQEQLVKSLSGIKEAEALLSTLHSTMQRVSTLKGSQRQLTAINKDIATGTAYCEESRAKIQLAKEEYSETLKNFKKCPVCFGELNEEHLHQVVASL